MDLIAQPDRGSQFPPDCPTRPFIGAPGTVHQAYSLALQQQITEWIRLARLASPFSSALPQVLKSVQADVHLAKMVCRLWDSMQFQDASAKSMPEQIAAQMLKRVQDAGNEVVDAKKGKGSSTLSMAYAASRFAHAVLAGRAGEPCAETALVKTDIYPGVSYFSTKVTFGPEGVEKVHPVGPISPKEQAHLDLAVKTLEADIQEGLAYAENVDLAGRR
ncbi:mdh-2 [Symbiodinium sp. CCMP2456]|nr:mdh-2 [Symbiodinium sp. CCMP2456]